jgi:hypothetical protein
MPYHQQNSVKPVEPPLAEIWHTKKTKQKTKAVGLFLENWSMKDLARVLFKYPSAPTTHTN